MRISDVLFLMASCDFFGLLRENFFFEEILLKKVFRYQGLMNIEIHFPKLSESGIFRCFYKNFESKISNHKKLVQSLVEYFSSIG